MSCRNVNCILYLTGLQVCCGEAGVKGRYSVVELSSEAAVARFKQLNSFPPKDAAKFALRLMPVFFTNEELARSNCTLAQGRDLLNQEYLEAIKRKELVVS